MATADDTLFTRHPDLKRLLRALQLCQGFGLYFARCNTPPLRDELVAELKVKLGKPVVELILNPENDTYIDVQIAELLSSTSESTVVFIYDLEKYFYLKDRHLIQELNWRRGSYGRLKYPLVFWLPEFLLTEIFNDAPDFADWYSGIYEFSLSKTEQSQLLADTWQEASESFVGQLSLPEKQRWIINLRNLLAELDGQETSTTKSKLLNRLGMLYDSLGKYDKALDYYNKALSVSREVDDKPGEVNILNNISQIHDAKGDFDTALVCLKQAQAIQEAIGTRQGVGEILNNVGSIYHTKGNYDTALDYFQQALAIWQGIGDKVSECTTLNNISQMYVAKGDYDTGLGYLEKSLEISQATHNKESECVAIYNIGYNHHRNNDNQQALSYWLKSYQIAKQIGWAIALKHLDDLAITLGGEGLEFWETLSQREK